MSLKEKNVKFSQFVKTDMWRIPSGEVSGIKGIFFKFLKIIVLSIREFVEDRIQIKASALVYYTLLSVVPTLALVLGIARGFGFQKYLMQWSSAFFSEKSVSRVFGWVEHYLNQLGGGLIIGIGILILLWSIVNVFIQIENIFNDIWRVKKSRALVRKFTNYFAIMLTIPFLLILSSGISVYVSAALADFSSLEILNLAARFLVRLIPFIIIWAIFIIIYIVIPNTKVRFKNALLAGFIAGTAFQLFQIIYINGQIALSRYNAMYGSFAALPFLLLWLQISWLIVLYGAELAFASQNMKNYEFESDSQQISRRYRDFLILLISRLIIKRFEKGEKPYTMENISEENHIPIKLVSEIVYELMEAGILIETPTEEPNLMAFIPATDINKISVSYIMDKIESKGSECFNVDIDKTHAAVWKSFIHIREKCNEKTAEILIKDL